MLTQRQANRAEIDVRDLISRIEPDLIKEFGETMTKEAIESLNSMRDLLTVSFGEL